MKNIWTGKSRGGGIRLYAPLMIFAAAAALAVYGINRTSRADSEYMTENLRRGIMRAAVLCYSAEGAYPENFRYLEDNYGVCVNADKYTVHYGYAGGNIPPTVIVTERE